MQKIQLIVQNIVSECKIVSNIGNIEHGVLEIGC